MAAEYDHLPVYKAAYDLLQHVYRDKCIASVPRDVKYTLVERLKQDILEVLVLIYKAHYNMLGDKALQLQQARELIPGVKARMRIMYDLRYINLELFRTLAVEVESVSKQLGAWHTKTLRRRIVAPPAPAPARTAAPAPVAARLPLRSPLRPRLPLRLRLRLPLRLLRPRTRLRPPLQLPCPRTRLRPLRQPARLPLRLPCPRTRLRPLPLRQPARPPRPARPARTFLQPRPPLRRPLFRPRTPWRPRPPRPPGRPRAKTTNDV